MIDTAERITTENAAQTKKRGYDLIRSTGELPYYRPEYRHAPVLPAKSTYSPWLNDSAFREAYGNVIAHTLVDELRCYELWALVGQSGKLADGAFLEVGVWRGGTGTLIAQAARHFGISEPVFLCDTFTGVVKAGPQDTLYKGGEHSDTSIDLVQRLIGGLNLESVKILHGIFPEDTAHLIEGQQFRFAHLDMDVYPSTRDVMHWLWPRLAPGGIVVFDDYGTHGCEGVTQIVQEFSQRPDTLMIHNANGHAVIIKSC